MKFKPRHSKKYIIVMIDSFRVRLHIENLFIIISTKLDNFTSFLVFAEENSSLNFIMLGLL